MHASTEILFNQPNTMHFFNGNRLNNWTTPEIKKMGYSIVAQVFLSGGFERAKVWFIKFWPLSASFCVCCWTEIELENQGSMKHENRSRVMKWIRVRFLYLQIRSKD